MKVERFAAPLGARITELDLRADDDVAAVEQLLAEHHVLVFPGQFLSRDEHVEFGRRFGELIPFPYLAVDGYPEMVELRNRGAAPDINQHWHSDMSYEATPPKITMLSCREAPLLGGDTAFSNQHLAYEGLSDAFAGLLDGLTAVHSSQAVAELYRKDQAAPDVEHPVVRRHDDSGRPALYVCAAFTRRIVGWSRRESRALLEFLFEHSVRPEYQARHRWAPGDLVMWDNRSVLHFAVHDHGDDARVIDRLTVRGEVPYG